MNEHEEGLDLRLCAGEKGGFSPEPYLSRAETYLLVGKKNRAIAALDRGLRVEPEDRALLKERGEFGWRKPRVVSTLPRGHFVNRALGRLRRLVGARDSHKVQSRVH